MDDQQDGHENANQTTFPLHFVKREELARDEQAWTDKGNAAAQEGDYNAAAEAFEQAVAADPQNARSRYNLALAHQLLQETELAIAGYRRSIDLDPELIDAYINLGN